MKNNKINKKTLLFVSAISLTLLLSLSSFVTSLFLVYRSLSDTYNSFLIGDSFPTSNTFYKNKDVYLDSSSFKIYEYLNGEWILKVDLNDIYNLNKQNEDESKKKEEDSSLTKEKHSVLIDNANTINGRILVNNSEAYNGEPLIFLAEPINKESYSLNKLFFNDTEVSFKEVFIEGYYLYETSMIDEDVVVRGEFRERME